MVLRLRLRHALGEATFELDPSQGHQPHVIGRGPAATIEVPSLRVAHRHCAIFVHQGRWVLQDGNTRIGTLVNGRFLPGSRAVWPLSVNDLVRLGDDYNGPVLLVEQADAPAPGVEQGNGAGRPLHPPGSRAIDPAELAAVVREPPPLPPTEAPEVEWSTPVPRIGPIRARPRARRRMGLIGQTLLVLSTALVLAAGAGIYWTLRPQDAPAPMWAAFAERAPAVQEPNPAPTTPAEPPAAAVVPDAPQEWADSSPIEQEPEIPQPNQPQPDPVADAAGLVEVLGGVPADDPLRQSPAWQQVVSAREAPSVHQQLLGYEQYLSDSPEGPLRDVVAQWQEQALDQLWWERIGMLLDEEFALVDRQIEIESELRLLPPAQQARRAAELAQEQRQIRQRLMAIGRELGDEMAYDAGLVPNLSNSAQLQRLRLLRDQERYDAWKQEVMSHLRATRRLPWEAGPDDGGSASSSAAGLVAGLLPLQLLQVPLDGAGGLEALQDQ